MDKCSRRSPFAKLWKFYVQKSSLGPVRVLWFPWVQNVVTVVGRVRDGFSSKLDVAASFLPTVAAVPNHFGTLRRPKSRLLRQRRTDDAASFHHHRRRMLEPSPLRDGERRTIGSIGEAHRFCLQAAHFEDVQTDRCSATVKLLSAFRTESLSRRWLQSLER